MNESFEKNYKQMNRVEKSYAGYVFQNISFKFVKERHPHKRVGVLLETIHILNGMLPIIIYADLFFLYILSFKNEKEMIE